MIEAAALMALVVGDWGSYDHYLALLFNALFRVLGGTRSFQRARRFEEFSGFKSARASQWKMGASRCANPRARRHRLFLGDVVPADCKLTLGDYISIDQSALTGESLPVTKKSGEDPNAGSVVKQGEMVAVIAATGVNTFFLGAPQN